MKVEVLLSCMYQKDACIIEKNHIQTDVIVVNQCDSDSIEEFTFVNNKGQTCNAKFICTTQRGLSRSRNMAIANAHAGHICLICDDDEILADGYEDLILSGYSKYEDADVMAFSLNWNGFGKTYSSESYKLSFKETLRVCSVQITFKVDSIIKNNICFDVMLGSGTGNGAGEENRFMLDCRRCGLNMYYYPNNIATINISESQWFKGFTEQYFKNHGWATRRVFRNDFLALGIIIYYALSKRTLYKAEISTFKAIKCMLKGFFEKR